MRWLTAGALIIGLLTSCGSESSSSSLVSPSTTSSVAVDEPPEPSTVSTVSSIDHSAESADIGMVVVRVVPPIQEVPTTTNPCASAGLRCLPFAPEGLSDCDEMAFYRLQWELPDRFQALGYRESNCRNEEAVRTWCCYGYWQMYFTQHFNDLQGRPIYDACEVDEPSDYNGDEPLDKQKQACTAKGLYELSGYGPWMT